MECRAYGICLDSQSRGYLGKDRKVSSAAGGNLSRMHKTEETAKESRLNFMYSHLRNRTLAGSLGVKITEAIVGQGLLREVGRDYQLTKKGAQWFSDLGIDINRLRESGRVFARQCLDWSERRNHLAGALGSALAQHLFEVGWIEHVRESRAVRITELGRRELKRLLGVELRLNEAV